MTKKKPLTVTVAGVRVSVNLDDDGRPRSAAAGIKRSDCPDHELLVALAASTAFEAASQRAKRKYSSDNAAATSAAKRAEKSAEHWANALLARAHAAHPEYGWDRLRQSARRLAALEKIEPKKRDEISGYRARRFLKSNTGR